MSSEITVVDLPDATPFQKWRAENSRLGWDVSTISRQNIVRVSMNDATRRYVLPTHKGLDYDTIVRDDLTAQSVACEHHALHVEGNIAANTIIEGRDGVLSAKSLAQDVEVKGCSILILESFLLSKKSKSFQAGLYMGCPIIEVPAAHREAIWRKLSGVEYDPSIPPLNRNRSNIGECLAGINAQRWLKGAHGINPEYYGVDIAGRVSDGKETT